MTAIAKDYKDYKKIVDAKKTVEAMLKEYPYAKRALEAGLFPRLVPLYEELPGGGSWRGSTTERSAIMRVEKETLCQTVEFALEYLPPKERAIIVFFYLSDDREPVKTYCDQNYMTERHFYRLKTQALYRMAEALKLI